MPNLPYSTSGWTTHAQVGPAVFDFPYPDDPSVYVVKRTYQGPLSSYAAPTMLTADAVYTSHYLVAQSALTELDGGQVRYSRLFAPIPGDRTVYGAAGLGRPNLHGALSGTWYAASFDDGESSWIFPSRVSVSTVAALSGGTNVAVAAETFGTLPSTSVTFAEGANSVSVNLNSSASSIQSSLASALTGLTSVSVAATADSLTVSWVGTMKSVSTSATGVTMAGGAGSDGSVTFTASRPSVNDTQTEAAPSRVLTTGASHGGSAGEWLAVWNGNRLLGVVKALAASGTSITIPADEAPWNLSSLAVTHVAFASTGVRLRNGLDAVSTKLVTTWRLPGVSAGITTAADIPLDAVATAAQDWLAAIVARSLTSVTATASNDRLTKTAHGLQTGEVFFLTAIGSGAAGLSTLQLYYAIRVDADNFKVATSQKLAIAGTAVDITTDGTSLTVVVPEPWPVIETPGLERWLGSAIYARTTISAQMADALDQLPATG